MVDSSSETDNSENQPSHKRNIHSSSLLRYLIIMTGLPGSGKSSIAHHIAKNIDQSIILSRFSILRPYMNKHHWLHLEREECKQQVDYCFYDKATSEEAEAKILIFDGCFHTRAKRQKALEFAQKKGFVPIVIKCSCKDLNALRERLQRQVLKKSKNLFGKSVDELIDVYTKGYEDISRDEGIPAFIEYDTIQQKPNIIWTNDDLFVKDLEKILSYFYRIPSGKKVEKHVLRSQNHKKPPQERDDTQAAAPAAHHA